MVGNNLKQDLTIISIVPLNFTTNNGDKISGFTIHAYRDAKDSDNVIGKVYEKFYLNSDNVDEESKKYSSLIFPKKATIEFEFVDLKHKPKPKKLII